jgi:hypothetical protein
MDLKQVDGSIRKSVKQVDVFLSDKREMTTEKKF